MNNWRESMNADIITFFDIEYSDAEVIAIEGETREVGGCRTCSWNEFYVEVTFSTGRGSIKREYAGNIAEFFNAVWEAGEKRRELEGDETETADVGGDYGWGHRSAY